MADPLQSLYFLNGKEQALGSMKSRVDQLSLDLAAMQVANAAEKAPVVASLNGLDTIGQYSSIDQALRSERFAGKAASVDFIKANPTCTEAEAVAAWDEAGKAATGLPVLLQNTENLAIMYRANLARAGMIPDTTWESQRAWIVATDKAVIMGA